MILEISYDSMDAVPEQFRDLYSDQNGKAVLTGVTGIKTEKDVLTLQEALRKERELHAAAKKAVDPWKTLGPDPDTVRSQIDRIAELEAAAGGKLDDQAINKLVESRLTVKLSPLERKIQESEALLGQLRNENSSLKDTLVSRDRNEEIRRIATELKVLPTAIMDIEMIAGNFFERDETTGEFIVKSGVKGATPGSDIRTFFKDMQKQRPHWWPASAGGGAGGSGSGGIREDNPWSAAHWNLTAQGQYVKTHGEAKAEQAAKAAGVTLGATKPAAKKS